MNAGLSSANPQVGLLSRQRYEKIYETVFSLIYFADVTNPSRISEVPVYSRSVRLLQSLKSPIPQSSFRLPAPTIHSASTSSSASGGGALSSLIAASGYDRGVLSSAPKPEKSSVHEEVESDCDELARTSLSRGVDLSKPVASLLWTEEVMPFGSAISFVRMSQWNDKRNKHEAEALAWSLDAFVSEGLSLKSVSFEVQVRRLLGVKLADEHRDWSLAEALAWKSGHGIQNRSLLRSLLKDRKNFVDLSKSTKTRGSFKTAVTGSGRGGRRGGRGSSRFQSASQPNSSQKPSSGGSDAAAR